MHIDTELGGGPSGTYSPYGGTLRREVGWADRQWKGALVQEALEGVVLLGVAGAGLGALHAADWMTMCGEKVADG